MRFSGGTYGFDRPPAPEELVTIGGYINQLLSWGVTGYADVGKNVWAIISKSDHDRAVLEHMMRFHPDFLDLEQDGRNMSEEDVYTKFGQILLEGVE